MAIEDDRALGAGYRSLAALRNAGLSAEMIATGSPRKRYDKAAKILAKVLVSINMDGEQIKLNIRSVPGQEEHARVATLLDCVTRSQ